MLIVIGEEVVYPQQNANVWKDGRWTNTMKILSLAARSLLKSANKSLNVLYGFALWQLEWIWQHFVSAHTFFQGFLWGWLKNEKKKKSNNKRNEKSWPGFFSFTVYDDFISLCKPRIYVAKISFTCKDNVRKKMLNLNFVFFSDVINQLFCHRKSSFLFAPAIMYRKVFDY